MFITIIEKLRSWAASNISLALLQNSHEKLTLYFLKWNSTAVCAKRRVGGAIKRLTKVLYQRSKNMCQLYPCDVSNRRFVDCFSIWRLYARRQFIELLHQMERTEEQLTVVLCSPFFPLSRPTFPVFRGTANPVYCFKCFPAHGMQFRWADLD